LCTVGATQDILDKFQTYQADMNNLFQNLDVPHVKKIRMSIIYNLFRMLNTDRQIRSEEMKAIYIRAKKLDVTEEQVQEIQNLYEEEELCPKRASLLFPRGFNDVLIEYQKLR
jgi:uncharacterized tellurite resistance protein B-like protein